MPAKVSVAQLMVPARRFTLKVFLATVMLVAGVLAASPVAWAQG